MKILSLESSTKHFSLAVSREDCLLASKNIFLKKVLSHSIIPGISQVLKKSNVKFNQLDGFAVGLGPGSFTSLRVGLATVKGIAFASKKPVVGISSLDILAMNVELSMEFCNAQSRFSPLEKIGGMKADSPAKICTIADAKRNLVYGCLYEKKRGELKRKSKYMLVGINEWLDQVKGQIFFIGDGIKLYRDTIEHTSKRGTFTPIFVEEKFWYPQAIQLALLAFKRFQKGKIDPIDRLVPLYLYPEDCQVRK